ncbi:hypothetical protein [Haloprofundus salilacus]|uniref:hypothetical protein n=1 Tax=Haloprofundus salilacus TaxID=2876190 RepID=UPI001CCA3EA6|nr:hypothetical protein [Haloprofundus salilacus]
MDEEIQQAVVDVIKGSNNKTVEIRPADESKGFATIPRMLLIGGALAVGYWMAKSKNATKDLKSMMSKTADRTEKMSKRTAETIKKSGETAAERVEKESQRTGEQVQKMGEKAAEKTQKASEQAAEKTEKAGEKTAEKTEKAGEKAAEKTEEASEKVDGDSSSFGSSSGSSSDS